jgi:hypothetical protein
MEAVREYIDEQLAPLAEFHQQQRYAAAHEEANNVLVESFVQFGIDLTDEVIGDLREEANQVLPEYQELLLSQGVPREVVYGRETGLAVLSGLADFYGPDILAANRRGGDEMDVVARYTRGAGDQQAERPPTPGLTETARYAINKHLGAR